MGRKVLLGLLLFAGVAMSLASTACSDDGGNEATPTAVPGAITIDPPAEGAMKIPFHVSGTANVFEGVLLVQAIDPAGVVLCEQQVQATSGSGTPGTWETTFALTPPEADQTITIKAFDRSAKDGSVENIVTDQLTVSAELPAIVIESPRCNYEQYTASVLNVNGTASVFEAALIVEVRAPDGTVLQSKPVTASAGGPERGTWQVSLDVTALTPGPYQVVAYSISAKDGSPENIFAIPIQRTI